MDEINEIKKKGIYVYIHENYCKNKYSIYKELIQNEKLLNAHIEFLTNKPFFFIKSNEPNIKCELYERYIKSFGIYEYIQNHYSFEEREFKFKLYKKLMSDNYYLYLHIESLKYKEVLG